MAGVGHEKAAELVCIGVHAPTLDDETKRLLDAGVCGVVLYSDQLAGPAEVHNLVGHLKRHAGRPLFVAVDHEAGAAVRLNRGFTHLPDLRHLGLLGDAAVALEFGRLIGRELRAVGIDLCLGPVLDVDKLAGDSAIGARSLGSDPRLVAELGTQICAGIQAEGVAACGKHFPGHGDTTTDSNQQLPVLAHGVGRLEEVELLPFARAVQARIAALMVGHILFRALDAKFPASLSRPILFGLLRQRLGYRGLVLSDDVAMPALSEHFRVAEIAEYGIAAGTDCFLCARKPATALALIEAIALGVEQGTIVPERVEAARRRVNALIHRYALAPTSPAFERVGSEAHARLVAQIQGSAPRPV